MKITYPVEEKTLNGLNVFIQDDDYHFISDNMNEFMFSDSDGRTYSIYHEFTLPQSNEPIRINFIASDFEQHVLPLKIEFYSEY